MSTNAPACPALGPSIRRQASSTAAKLAAPIEFLRHDGMLLNLAYRDLLQSQGLDHFDALWRLQQGEYIKRIKTRSVVRFALCHQNRQRLFYLKRHRREWRGWPLPRGQSPLFKTSSQGMAEFEHCVLFRRHGLATVQPVIAGQRRVRLFWIESFMVTEDFAPFVSLEDLIRDHPEFFQGLAGQRIKRELLGQVARLARRMHRQGMHHLDFNATHILVHYDQATAAQPQIAFFDLQRVSQGRQGRWRWMIKALARLSQTLPEHLFSDKDRLHLLLTYKNIARLDLLSRLQWLWIKRKTDRIRRHTRKIDALKQRERQRRGLSGR